MRGRKVLIDGLGERATGLEVLVRQPRRAEASAIDYRVRTMVPTDHDAATRLCTEIIAAGHPDCLVILHNAARGQSVPVTESRYAAGQAESGGDYRIQLASYRTERRAARGREFLSKLLGDKVAAMEVLVRRSHAEGTPSIDFTIRTASLQSREEGVQMCDAIRAAGHPGCLVILHNPARWQAVTTTESRAAAGEGDSDAQYRVQLASYRSEMRATRGRQILSRLLGDQLKELEILVRRSHAEGSKSIDFTIRTAPLPSREEGARLCDAIRNAGHPGCLVIRHNDAFWQLAGLPPRQETAVEPQETTVVEPQEGAAAEPQEGTATEQSQPSSPDMAGRDGEGQEAPASQP
jgi:hypothetical protein